MLNEKISKTTRRESYIRRPLTRALEIVKAMDKDPLTARQIMIRMGFTDMNMVRPRLTELEKAGLIKQHGKAYDETTKRNVTVWQVV